MNEKKTCRVALTFVFACMGNGYVHMCVCVCVCMSVIVQLTRTGKVMVVRVYYI